MRLDLLLAMRGLRREWLTTTTVVVVAGASVAIFVALFALVDDVLFRPLPFPQAERIVHLSAPPEAFRGLPDSELEALAVTVESSTLVANGTKALPVNVFDAGSDAVEDWRLNPRLVSPSFFALFGPPMFGDGFDDMGDGAQSPRPVVISYQVWSEHFNAQPSTIGRTVIIPGTPFDAPWLVTGVMPPGFEFPFGTNFWILDDRSVYQDVDIPTYVRLADGVTLPALESALPGVVITPLREHITPEGTTALLGLLGATVLLLFLSWSQFAGLAISRALDQSADVGLRKALGANTLELVRPVVFEAGIVAVAATAVAGWAGPLVLEALRSALPPDMLAGRVVAVAPRALWLAGAVTTLAIALVGIGHVWASSRLSPGELLASGDRSTEELHVRTFRGGLLASQVTATVVLIYIAGIAWHASRRADEASLGFSPAGLWAVRLPGIAVPPTLSPDEGRLEVVRQQSLYEVSLDQVSHAAGVTMVAASSVHPLEQRSLQLFPVYPDGDPDHRVGARFRYGGPGYAATLALTVLDGRDFASGDPTGATVLINRTLARQLAPGRSLVGSQIRASTARAYVVVGVYDDMVVGQAGEAPSGEMVIAGSGPVVLFRTNSAATFAVTRPVLDALAEIWGNRAPRHLVNLSVEADRARQAFTARQALTTAVALAGAPIAALGIVGAVVTSARSRRKEIATRLVLGATLRNVQELLVRRSALPIAAGIGIGLCCGWLVAQAASRFLFGVSAVDWQSSAIAGASILFIYIAAVLASSRRVAHHRASIDLLRS